MHVCAFAITDRAEYEPPMNERRSTRIHQLWGRYAIIVRRTMAVQCHRRAIPYHHTRRHYRHYFIQAETAPSCADSITPTARQVYRHRFALARATPTVPAVPSIVYAAPAYTVNGEAPSL